MQRFIIPFHCCYGVCKSDSRKPEDGVTFMPFPKPNKYLQIAKRWVYLCARDNFTTKKITRNTYICSKHFPVGEVLNIKANPTLEPYNARKPFREAKIRRKLQRKSFKEDKIRRKLQRSRGVPNQSQPSQVRDLTAHPV